MLAGPEFIKAFKNVLLKSSSNSEMKNELGGKTGDVEEGGG